MSYSINSASGIFVGSITAIKTKGKAPKIALIVAENPPSVDDTYPSYA